MSIIKKLALFTFFGLFLSLTKTFAQTAFTPNTPEVFFKIPVGGPDPYDIILKPLGSTGKFIITAQRKFADINGRFEPEGKMLFFVILPDGNFISLNEYTQTGGIVTPYKMEVELQHPSGGTMQIANMKAWSFKKNDPTKPPPPEASNAPNRIYKDASDIPQPTFTVNAAMRASQYLRGEAPLKIGTSWAPWDRDSAYYYLIISYTNNPNAIDNLSKGAVKLNLCYEKTGFEAKDYFTYNDPWTIHPIPSDTIFPFSNVAEGEIRHLYIRMERVKKAIDTTAQYRAQISYYEVGGTPDIPTIDTTTYTTECKTIILSTSPHDPNRKMVDQNNCTANGTGKLIYTIYFQNEGSGPARHVLIKDRLPNELIADSVKILASSAPVTLARAGVDSVLFTFNNIYLPGSAQIIPITDYTETIGWVQFSCNATCPDVGKSINNMASIVFFHIDSTELAAIETANIATVADNSTRPNQWPVVNSPCRPKCCICIGGRRCKWCLCFFRYCRKEQPHHQH